MKRYEMELCNGEDDEEKGFYKKNGEKTPLLFQNPITNNYSSNNPFPYYNNVNHGVGLVVSQNNQLTKKHLFFYLIKICIAIIIVSLLVYLLFFITNTKIQGIQDIFFSHDDDEVNFSSIKLRQGVEIGADEDEAFYDGSNYDDINYNLTYNATTEYPVSDADDYVLEDSNQTKRNLDGKSTKIQSESGRKKTTVMQNLSTIKKSDSSAAQNDVKFSTKARVNSTATTLSPKKGNFTSQTTPAAGSRAAGTKSPTRTTNSRPPSNKTTENTGLGNNTRIHTATESIVLQTQTNLLTRAPYGSTTVSPGQKVTENRADQTTGHTVEKSTSKPPRNGTTLARNESQFTEKLHRSTKKQPDDRTSSTPSYSGNSSPKNTNRSSTRGIKPTTSSPTTNSAPAKQTTSTIGAQTITTKSSAKNSSTTPASTSTASSQRNPASTTTDKSKTTTSRSTGTTKREGQSTTSGITRNTKESTTKSSKDSTTKKPQQSTTTNKPTQGSETKRPQESTTTTKSREGTTRKKEDTTTTRKSQESTTTKPPSPTSTSSPSKSKRTSTTNTPIKASTSKNEKQSTKVPPTSTTVPPPKTSSSTTSPSRKSTSTTKDPTTVTSKTPTTSNTSKTTTTIGSKKPASTSKNPTTSTSKSPTTVGSKKPRSTSRKPTTIITTKNPTRITTKKPAKPKTTTVLVPTTTASKVKNQTTSTKTPNHKKSKTRKPHSRQSTSTKTPSWRDRFAESRNRPEVEVNNRKPTFNDKENYADLDFDDNDNRNQNHKHGRIRSFFNKLCQTLYICND